MNNGKPLSQVTQQLIPDLFDKIEWNNIWNRKVETGTAFEWTTFAALVKVAKDNHIKVSIPLIEQYNAPDYFILRNEIPHPHGAQPGNSATLLSSKDLGARFFYSLVPKAIFKSSKITVSLFREGCPYHKVMCGKNYLERTDIMFLPGEPNDESPMYNKPKTEVSFSYNYPNQTISGNFRIMNSSIIPCRSRTPHGGYPIVPTGIIECSVNKKVEVAKKQIEKYDALFSTSTRECKFSLITGNDLSILNYDNHSLNLSTDDTSIILNNFVNAAEKILKHFSIIAP